MYEVDRNNRKKNCPADTVETPSAQFVVDPENADTLSSIRASLFITEDEEQDNLLKELIRTANYRVRDFLRREISTLTVRDNFISRENLFYLSNIPSADLSINYYSGDNANYGQLVTAMVDNSHLSTDAIPQRDNSYFYDRTNNRLVWSGNGNPTNQKLADEFEYPVFLSYSSNGISNDPRILDAVQKMVTVGFAQRAGRNDISTGPIIASLRDTLSPLIRGEL